MADIGGVVFAVLQLQPEVGAQERRAQLGDELLARVTLVREFLASEIAIETRAVPSRMSRLMAEGRVIGCALRQALSCALRSAMRGRQL